VLEYHIDWLNTLDDFIDEQGKWLYALLVRLELPLTPDVCSLLRTLARTCAQKRDALVSMSVILQKENEICFLYGTHPLYHKVANIWVG
jgi:hypothetical protein